jgi:hypothetical protein
LKNIKVNDDSAGTKHGINKDGGGAKTIAGNKKTTGVRKTGTA